MDTRPLMGPMGQAYLKSDEYGKTVPCMDITCKISPHNVSYNIGLPSKKIIVKYPKNKRVSIFKF